MIRSARANLLLLTSRNYLLAGLGCTGLLAFIAVMLNVGSAEATADERGPLGESPSLDQLASARGLALALGGTVTFAGLVLMAVNATAVASDYSTGTVRNQLVRQPDRLRLLAGKSLALAVATAAVTALVVAITIVSGVAFAPDGVDTAEWFTVDGLRALAETSGNLYLAALGWGLIGQVVATLSRSSVVALTTGVMIAIPLDMIVTQASDSARAWLPGQLFQAVARGGTQHLEYASSLTTVVVGGLAALTVALAVFRHRDVTS
jgi:ABC-type transport system involved in multi-copper enzyme maturation permease subunit